MTTVAELEVKVGADTAELETGLRNTNNKISNFAKNAGKKIVQFGAVAGGAMLGAAGLAVNSAIQWESSWANVVKTVDASDEELAALEGTLRDMATSPVFGALDNAHETLADIASSAGQLGVETSAIDEFTASIAALTVATPLAADEAAQFAAQFANVTGLDIATDIDNLADTIVTLGNNMATTEDQIVAFGGRMAGLSTAGFGPAEILAWGAAMASVGITAELGSTNFTKFVDDMQRFGREGGEELNRMAEVAGLTSSEFAELAASDPSAAMDAFVGGLAALDDSEVPQVLDDLNVTGTEQRSVLTKLAGGYDTVTESLDLANEAWAGNGAAMAEAESKSNTTEGSINRLKNTANDIAITLGDKFLPAVNDGADALQAFLEGDHETALESLKEAFVSLVDGIGQIWTGDQDFDFGTTIDQWVAVFEMGKLALDQIFFKIGDGISDFFRDIQIQFLSGLSDLLNTIPEFARDQIPELDVAIKAVNLSLENVQEIEGLDQLADQWSASINEVLSSGDHLMLSSGFQQQIMNPDFRAELDPITLANINSDIEAQLTEAISSDDEEAISMLLPIATELGLDTADIFAQAQDGVRDAIESQDMEATGYVSLTLVPAGINRSLVDSAIQSSLASPVNVTVPVNTPGGEVQKFHEGGLVTGRSGQETLALLQGGEGVFTRSQMKALGIMAQGNSGNGKNGTTIINSYGRNPDEVARMVDRSHKDRGYRD